VFKFIFLLVIVPLTELYVLIEVGSSIGGLSVILLIIMTAILGVSFMRQQGMMTMQKIQQGIVSGQAPEKEILESVFIFIGGLFLLLPGFISDTLGLLFLIPTTRSFFAGLFVSSNKFKQQGNVYEAEWSETKPQNRLNPKASNDDIIEGEIIKPDDKK